MSPLHADPESRAAILALFDSIWPQMSQRLALAARVGGDWMAASTPFVAFEGRRAIAHVGLLSIPVVLGGQRVTVAGIHAVGSAPDRRRCGHVGRLLERAVAAAAACAPIACLTTEVPRVFRRHGFVEHPQHAVEVPPARVRARGASRRLSIDDPADVAIVHRLCSKRTPVSHRCGVVEPGWLFVSNEVLAMRRFARLHYLADLETLVACDVVRGTLEIYDVVASELPPLDELLARIELPHHGVTLLFAPDRFDVKVLSTAPAYPGDAVMFRGDPCAGEGPWALPLLAHC